MTIRLLATTLGTLVHEPAMPALDPVDGYALRPSEPLLRAAREQLGRDLEEGRVSRAEYEECMRELS